MKYIFILLFSLISQSAISQELQMRPLKELINTEELGWDLVKEWMKEAKNKIEILAADSEQAHIALHRT